ncbi:MAG: Arc family DNA-binding protein [Roseiarcus sp.]|jgi:hypothetical protein
MVKTPISERIADIPPFGLRLTPDLKQRVEASARANSRSLNAEITARLEHSFRAELPIASDTAIEALKLAKENARHLAAIEEGLRAICSADEFLDVLNEPAQRLFAALAARLTR